MELLDAVLALALTLAALATVATIVVESLLRLLRMRGQKLIQGLELALDEATGDTGPLRLPDDERRQFVNKVAGNPGRAKKPSGKPGKEAPNPDSVVDGAWQRWRTLARCYDKVSLEHVVKQLVALPSVKALAAESRESLKDGVSRFAKQYEEACSSVSAAYRRRAQSWSMLFGIGLALLANVDGLRIFEVYRNDPAVRAAVIAQEERFRELAETDAGSSASGSESEPGSAQDAMKREKQRVLSAEQALVALGELGVPLGWAQYPACPYGSGDGIAWATSGPRCRGLGDDPGLSANGDDPCPGDCEYTIQRVLGSLIEDGARFTGWLVSVLVTGALIGLGGPFWFDVAKRLAQIRRGINKATASSEDRLSGRDANGDRHARETIVGEVVDALG